MKCTLCSNEARYLLRLAGEVRALACPECTDNIRAEDRTIPLTLLIDIDPTQSTPPNLKIIFDEWCRLREIEIERRFLEKRK